MVRIALISDIHFGKLSRTDEFAVPGEPIQDENQGAYPLKDSLIAILKENQVKYIFVAGDLTSLGSPQEFHYCEQIILNIAEEVGITHDRVFIGLGNHDVDWKITKIHEEYSKSTGADFPIDLIKEKYRLIAANASSHNMSRILQPKEEGPAPFSGMVENDDFIIFILNSGWCCTHDQQFPHGKLTTDQLNWFEENVKNYETDKRWKIVLMHHHPYSYTYPTQGIDISMIEEGSSLLEIAGKNGINLILHGHRHHPKAETTLKNEWKNPITCVCAGSLTVNSNHRNNGEIPNMVHVLELTNEIGALQLYNFQYSPAEGWIPLRNNCPATPMDYKMRFGKLYKPEEIEEAMRKLTKVKKEICWDDLDDCLYYLPINELNNEIERLNADTHKMIGRFPDEVVFFER